MDGHPLIELAHMLYKVCLTIVNKERRLMEVPWKFSPSYLVCKRGFRDLILHLVHNVISHTFTRWALIFSPMVTLFIVGERFAGRSS